MAETHVITGLKARRASIAEEIDELERQRRKLLVNLRHVDGALKVMGYEGNPEAIPARKKRRNMFRRGQLRRFIYAAQRKHGPDISHAGIAAIILQEMEWAEETDLLQKVTEKVRQARKDIRRRGAANNPSTDG
ncbi:hypothetical protein [Hyphococcus sp.]|uniref:hypothetical protein n=1 Tax=Hyphococcus sp. TaxID=2038636 RepID=UPI0035C785E8